MIAFTTIQEIYCNIDCFRLFQFRKNCKSKIARWIEECLAMWTLVWEPLVRSSGIGQSELPHGNDNKESVVTT